MGAPALRLEQGETVEERLTRLESDVKHIQSDVSEMKAHLLRTDGKIDAVVKSVSELNVAFVQSTSQLKLALEQSTSELKLALEQSTSRLKVWWLVTLLATILGAVARGFKWI